MFSVEHASPMGPAVMEEGGGGGGKQASCLVAKQAVEFPQVLASIIKGRSRHFGLGGLHSGRSRKIQISEHL